MHLLSLALLWELQPLQQQDVSTQRFGPGAQTRWAPGPLCVSEAAEAAEVAKSQANACRISEAAESSPELHI